MYIDRHLDSYIIFEEESILNTLKKIDAQSGRIVCVITDRGLLVGVVTNGDILRWLINHDEPDLQQPITSIVNRDCRKVSDADPRSILHDHLKQVLYVPVVNEQGLLIAVARRDHPQTGIRIGEREIGPSSPCFVIAEIGNNHNGSVDLAKKLVDHALEAGADCAKFQMRDMASLYSNAGDSNDAKENLGSQYTLDLLNKFQLAHDDLFEVFDYCAEKGIIPLCTPWDSESIKRLETYGMPAYKVASADLTNHELLIELGQTGKPIICSTGMSTEKEILETEEILQQHGIAHVMLHCNSTYPAPFGDINLSYIKRLQHILKCPVGYSGHERGINVSVAAAALGSVVVERHLTVDRSMEGSDHKASLLPVEFADMVKGIREVQESMGVAAERKLSQGEMINRVNLAKSLIINTDIEEGEMIREDMIAVKSPGRGLQPNYKQQLVGTPAKRSMEKGEFFYMSDLVSKGIQVRDYHLTRPWGIAVRYHDFEDLLPRTNLDLVEFHLSYKDLELDESQFMQGTYDIDFVVHSPELFEGDHTLDLCSPDDAYRLQSIKELQRVIDLTRRLKVFFPKTKVPLIIVNVGGFSSSGFLSQQARRQRIDHLEKALDQLDAEGVELIPQTMPPFPWHFGGQHYHNLFIDADQIRSFCEKRGMRICLDTSHSKLACTHYKWSFKEFLEKVAPYSAHLHLADAEKTGGEGLQVGQGEIDWHMVADVLNELAPDASFIPEIWQGHENRGEGFWIAMDRLEKQF